LELTGNENKLFPACASLAFGEFAREGREIYLITNTGEKDYRGALKIGKGRQYVELDPQTGRVSEEREITNYRLPLEIAPLDTKIVVTY